MSIQTDRRLQILNLLRGRRAATTADYLAEKLNVSTRTVYRDMQRLENSGIPLEAEAGVGYRLMRDFDLPPLMFAEDEVEALILGMRMVRAWSDEHLAASANSAMAKILAVLPQKLRDLDDAQVMQVPAFSELERRDPHSLALRQSIKELRVVTLRYCDAEGRDSERKIWPLGLFFWGSVWTLLSWCTLRADYRSFRLDRIESLQVDNAQFQTHAQCSLDHYLNRIREARHYCPSEHSRCSL